MPSNKSLFLQKIDQLSIYETGKSAENTRIESIRSADEIKMISDYQDFIQGGKMQLIRDLKTKCEDYKLQIQQLKKETIASNKTISVIQTENSKLKQDIHLYQISLIVVVAFLLLLISIKSISALKMRFQN